MYIYLLRHGDAVPEGHDDASRLLSPIGENQVRLVASTLKKLDIAPGTIIHSPLIRAIQTAGIIHAEIPADQMLTSEYLVPSTNHKQLLDQMRQVLSDHLLLVGHEPHLSTFISLLISGTTSARIVVKKASLACVECVRPIQPGTGVLRWLLAPEQMESLQ